MKAIVLQILLLSASISLAGCFHGEKISRVYPGMPGGDVHSIMGQQEGYKRVGDYEVYSYYNKLISGWAWHRADYHYR